MALDTLNNLRNGLTSLISKAQSFIGANPLASVSAAAAGGLGAGTLVTSAISSARKRKKKAKKNYGKKRRRRSRARKASSRRHRGRHKHRSSARGKLTRHTHRGTKGIHYTSKGQPYIILASGKARFISMRSAKTRKSRKGGYY